MDAKLKKIGFIVVVVLGTMIGAQIVAGMSIPLLGTVAKKATGKA